MSILKVVKYQIHDALKVISVFYIIILIIGFIMAAIGMYNKDSVGYIGGLGISTVIFLFAWGLNCFKTNFLFMQANNISRRKFYFASLITLTTLSVFMAVLEVIMNKSLQLAVPYKGIYEQLYRKEFIFGDFLWSFSLYVFAVSSGWLITMIFYRCDKIMRTIVSLMPAFLIILIGVIDNISGGILSRAIIDFLGTILGFTDNYNSYRAVLSFGIGAAGLYALCFLIIRRIPIKG
jgi:hypothetical protein